MKNYIMDGERLTYANASGSTISAGTMVLVTAKVGVAPADIANGDSGVLAMEGVYNITKLGTDVVAQGALLYWDNTNKRLTVTSSGNTLAGFAFAAAGNGVTSVDICINR